MKVCWGVGRGNCGHVYMRRPPYVIPEEATYLKRQHTCPVDMKKIVVRVLDVGKALKQISGI